MTNTTTPQELGERIERLVQEYISETRVAVHAAMDRAFASHAAAKVSERWQSSARKSGSRRASSEVPVLGERLYEAVCAKRGETMTVFGPLVGRSARELGRPMTLLKRAGRVRSVGTRNATRYFPMAGHGQSLRRICFAHLLRRICVVFRARWPGFLSANLSKRAAPVRLDILSVPSGKPKMRW